MKSKDFIPEKFYQKKQANINEKENGMIIIFLILNLIALPTTAKNIEKIKEKPVIKLMDMETDKSNQIELDQINLWIENILNDDIDEVCINKNKGEIIIKSLDSIENLSSNKFISISDVNLKNDGKYKLGVNLHE
jgi:hypothetical protein